MLAFGELMIIAFLVLIPGLIALVLNIAALVDILKHRFQDNDKIVWILVVLMLPLIGAILYFAFGSKHKIRD